MFGHLDLEAKAGLEVIPVPRSAYEAKDTVSLAAAVVSFVNRAVQDARFRRTELPAEAMQAFLVDFYIGCTSTAGHAAFVAESGWQDYVIVEIRAGLHAIGQREAVTLFEDLVALVGEEPEALTSRACASLDLRFASSIGRALERAERDWLRSLDCLLVVDDADHAAILEALPRRNPRLEHAAGAEGQDAQGDESGEAAPPSRYLDPVAQACEFVCMVSTPDRVHYEAWQDKAPTVGPEGIRGMSVRFTAHGNRRGEVLLFPHYAALLMADDILPRPPVAIDLVQDHVRRMTGGYLPADFWR